MPFQLKQFMTKKDWAYLVILVIVTTGVWIWVWREYQKPLVDPSWYASTVSAAGHDDEFDY